MTTSLWIVDKNGDQLATDNAVSMLRARESMVDAATDLSLVEVKHLYGNTHSVTSMNVGWVLITTSSPSEALLVASISNWTEERLSAARLQ